MRTSIGLVNSLCALVAAVVLSGCGGGHSGNPDAQPQVDVLSSDKDRVTGESALISIKSQRPPTVTLNGVDISPSFASEGPSGARMAVVQGLKVGSNVLVATTALGAETRVSLTDTPITGPLFSGVHQTPFVCETNTFPLPDGSTLGPAADADCSVPTKVLYIYKTTTGTFKPYDASAAKPSDMATTTTSEGKVLDFIVRIESGVINRSIYQIAFLHTPNTPLPTPGTRSGAWNGGLVYGFGGGCGAAYRQGRNTGFSPWAFVDGAADAVDLGYAVAAGSLTVLGNNCNDVTSAETVAMVKEHFIKQFGVPRNTIGAGGSGGSMQQHLIAQNYPGVLDGLLPGRSFADTLTVLQYAADCPLMNNYFATSTTTWTAAQKAAASGFASYDMCSTAWLNYLPRWVSPAASGCDAAVPRGLLYDPVGNPGGARCGYFDNLVNVWGKKPNGAAQRPMDNTGVQYGLNAFNAGTITAEQFVDLNEHIGGFNDDAQIVGARMAGDPQALQIAYRSGRVNEGTEMGATPIIDTRAYADLNTPADVHTFHTTFKMRARLIAANGDANNQVMWVVPSTGGLSTDLIDASSPLRRLHKIALTTMDQWLTNIASDTSTDAPRVKVLRNKPAAAVDACFDATLQKTPEVLSYTGTGTCMTRFPPHGDPRTAAGESIAGDTLKCKLKTLDRSAYAQSLTDAQWSRLAAIFASGVCDYTAPGVGQQSSTGTWQSF